jgi:hypothetical protein
VVAKRKTSPALLAAILAAHVFVTSLVWRDIRGRSDDDVRGSKRVWRTATALNTVGSVAYLLFGRTRQA